ncbi:lytic transglycosylase domain-containing protein [Aquabacterium sp. OR-4]|uniref:lytic transglycosylase domain-containing protein n=1 Tax=Aquabacterium sp. OR-4 TaxID=2978127 RepID=UPI0021B1FF47|nr:lytic transglycosylase domain-containing protein [Aquabacterium sp. OR-4]MDT7836345.1 lytic transglycosylase domain-containing protein [Aquabacterium sp. OR-4]
MTAIAKLRATGSTCLASAQVFVRDIGAGLLEVSHNSLALLGLVVLGIALFAGGRDDVRDAVERHTLDWLLARQEAREPAAVAPELMEPDAVARATAADPKALPRQQAAVAGWLSRRYRVAPEPVSRLVQEAWSVGQRMGLDPTLILAIMAIESNFNPFAQSAVGAQGLMQVMTRVHDDKYEAFGGVRAAFDPVSNLRVGVLVLKECIARAGGLEAGLRYYVGAANLADDGGYSAKVLAEQSHLRKVAEGKTVAFNAPLPAAVPVPVAPAASALETDATVKTPAPAAETADERVALLR